MRTALRTTHGALTGLLLAAPCLATTWVVDDNGGPDVDFVSISAAIAAASDGDVIEVRDGAYPGFWVDGKSLVIVGRGTSVRVGQGRVQNIGASQRVELDSLRFASDTQFPSLTLNNNTGSVRIVDCVVTGLSTNSYDYTCTRGEYPGDAARMWACEDVTFLRCEFRGGGGEYSYYCGYEGGTGLEARYQSTLNVLDSFVAGGRGSQSSGGPGGDGGDGLILDHGSMAFAAGSEFRGAPGEFGTPPGAHGEGVVLLGGSTMTWKGSSFDSIVPLASAQQVAIEPYCIGTYEECPCGNNGAGVAGCEHSFGNGGGRLEGVGNASVSADTVTLQLTGLGTGGAPTALFFQGTTGSEGTPFNDGLLCAGGAIRRMKGRAASNGSVSFGFGQAGDPSVSSAGQVPLGGGTRFYQVWYRNNNASFCTPLRFNMSNGVEIAWAP